MRCPFCGTHDTRVVDSRLANEGDQVKRRRQCTACERRFTTFESVELAPACVIKQNGQRQPFEEKKLRASIMKALEKRPVSHEAIESAIAKIKRELLDRADRDMSTRELGEKVMNVLKALDHVAYVRFASVYRNFQDVSEFTKVINQL